MSEHPDASTPTGRDAVAGVRPVDVDGVRAVAVGTVLWGVAFVALLPFVHRLRADGHLWWLATCAIGVGLGLLGLVYVTRRREAIRRQS